MLNLKEFYSTVFEFEYGWYLKKQSGKLPWMNREQKFQWNPKEKIFKYGENGIAFGANGVWMNVYVSNSQNVVQCPEKPYVGRKYYELCGPSNFDETFAAFLYISFSKSHVNNVELLKCCCMVVIKQNKLLQWKWNTLPRNVLNLSLRI